MTARQRLTARIQAMTTEQIMECVSLVGGGDVDDARRVLRANLLAEFERREGGTACDALMDAIGMPASAEAIR